MNKYLTPGKYINFAINRSLAWLEPMIRKWEKPYLEKFGSQPLKHQPIFIIGAPRTGSTILYQTLTNLYDVLYVDNLVCRFHKNFFFGFWLNNKLFGARPHNNYEADHGSTKGLNSPSECGQFWYRWLPTDHHFIDYDEITPQMVDEIRREITAVINCYDKPLIFNNNNAGLRIRLIIQAFPAAKWIVCDREPRYVAQSLLKARQIKSGGIENWWSILPPNYKELFNKDPIEQAVLQHYYINKQIYHDLRELSDNDDCIYVKYESFCLDFEKFIRLISKYFHLNNPRNNFQKPKISYNNVSCLDDDLLKVIEIQIKRLSWHDYSS